MSRCARGKPVSSVWHLRKVLSLFPIPVRLMKGAPTTNGIRGTVVVLAQSSRRWSPRWVRNRQHAIEPVKQREGAAGPSGEAASPSGLSSGPVRHGR